MAVFVGLLEYTDPTAITGEQELTMAKVARATTELLGGRFLSIYWTEGDVAMVLAYDGRDAALATKVFATIEEQQGVRIRVLPALSEGEKERAVQATP